MHTLRSAKFSGIASGIAGFMVATLLCQSAVVHAQSAPREETVPGAASPTDTDAAEPTPDVAAAPAEEVPPAVEASAEVGSEPPPMVTAEPIAAVPAEVAPVEVEPPSHTASYVLWGLGGASLVVGTVYGVLALQANSDFDDNPTTANADKTHDRAILADVGLGLGLILGITGTVFYFSKEEDGETTAQVGASKQRHALRDVRVAPFVTQRASGGTLSLRF